MISRQLSEVEEKYAEKLKDEKRKHAEAVKKIEKEREFESLSFSLK